MKRIYIIVGGLRPQWLGTRIAQWVRVNAKKQTNATVTIIDANDIALTNDELNDASKKKYDLSQADGYILIAPEYESGRQPVISNIINALQNDDSFDKPVAFVSYGLEGGYKLVDSLRTKVKSMNLAPLRNAVHIEQPWEVIDQSGELHDKQQERNLSLLIKQLTQWMAVAKAT